MELRLSIKQSQTLSPQMLQSIKILQMGTQELLQYIEESLQENPALETLDHSEPEAEFTGLQKKLEWLDGADRQELYSCRTSQEHTSDALENYSRAAFSDESLYDYLFSQLQTMNLSPQRLAAARFIAESLNSNGFLDESLEALAQDLHMAPACLEAALQTVQQLDPPGVGARSLAECLSLQLDRLEGDTSLAQKIVADHLPSLARSWYSQIAKSLSVPVEEVRAACDLIRSLNPKPGTGFAAQDDVPYIIPDLLVEVFPDRLELTSNDRYLPSLKLSSYYKSLMDETQDDEVKEYLTDKVRQAQWVIKHIEQRRSTLLRCAECILEIQEPFFRLGPGHLVPLGLSDLSSRLEVHESTVSRAIKDKYLQCSHGVYPLSYFFSRSLYSSAAEDSSSSTAEGAKALLKKLIGSENKKKPLSDQKLCDLMAREGCPISRRTVAKYRDELGIPSTTGRKEYT